VLATVQKAPTAPSWHKHVGSQLVGSAFHAPPAEAGEVAKRQLGPPAGEVPHTVIE
jgi:hypothetical protein